MDLKEQRNAASAAVHYPLTSCLKKILERCSIRAARTYGARNPCSSPIAISPAGTGSDKASYSHLWRHWQLRPRPALRTYGRLIPFKYIRFCTKSQEIISKCRDMFDMFDCLPAEVSYTLTKRGRKVMSITLLHLKRFLKFFHCLILR